MGVFFFDTTGADANSAGRGRGNGGDDAAPWCLAPASVTWFSQLVNLCAISDSGDRVSGSTGCGAWAWTDAAVNNRKHREKVAGLKIPGCTHILPASAPNPTRTMRLRRIRAMLRRRRGIHARQARRFAVSLVHGVGTVHRAGGRTLYIAHHVVSRLVHSGDRTPRTRFDRRRGMF